MRCVFCTHDLIATTKNEEKRNKHGDLIIFKDIPVYYCPDCKEYFYHEKVLDWMDNIIEKGTINTTSVPAYLYREEAASLV